MILKEIYEKVQMICDCGPADFLAHFDTSARGLIARYGKRYVVLPRAVYVRPESIEESVPVYEEYYGALLDDILYRATGNPDRKTDAVQEAEDAYKSVSKALLRGAGFRDADYASYTDIVRF